MSAEPRRGARSRRAPRLRRDARGPRTAPAAPAAAHSGGRPSRLALALVLLGGVLIGRYALALLPFEVLRIFDFAVAGVFALTVAMAYRRSMRRYLESRRAAERERGR